MFIFIKDKHITFFIDSKAKSHKISEKNELAIDASNINLNVCGDDLHLKTATTVVHKDKDTASDDPKSQRRDSNDPNIAKTSMTECSDKGNLNTDDNNKKRCLNKQSSLENLPLSTNSDENKTIETTAHIEEIKISFCEEKTDNENRVIPAGKTIKPDSNTSETTTISQGKHLSIVTFINHNQYLLYGIVPLKIFPILAILTLCEINFPLKFPASVILGVESTIFGLKIIEGKKYLSWRFRPVEVVVS